MAAVLDIVCWECRIIRNTFWENSEFLVITSNRRNYSKVSKLTWDK